MRQPTCYWITAFFYALLIFFISVFALQIGDRLGGFDFYQRALAIACFAFAAGIIFFLWKIRRRMTLLKWLGLLLMAGVYFLFYSQLDARVEVIHLINFSILTFLFQKAMEDSGKTRLIYLKAAGLSMLVGAADEIIQKFIPGRFAQMHDIWLCLAGSLLGCGLAWIFSSKSEKF